MGKVVHCGRMPQEMQDQLAAQGWVIVTNSLFNDKSKDADEKSEQSAKNPTKHEKDKKNFDK